MKILALSDLHLEFSNLTPSDVEVDVIVLAGDIWKNNHGIYWARATWPDKPIVYVAGNHEFYKRDRLDVLKNLRAAAEEQEVHFLENDEVVIDGVRFLGCTLWTDFCLFGVERQNECMEIARERLSDFSVISQNGLTFTPEDSLLLHHESIHWLSNKLFNETFQGKTVVVTHHCPSWQSVAERYQSDPLSACFASRIEQLLGKSELWIHGHTHDSFDYEVSGTRVICNPRGYLLRGALENLSFDLEKVLNVV